MFHISPNLTMDGKILKPRIPDYLVKDEEGELKFEDTTTKRVCFSWGINDALNAIYANLNPSNPVPDRIVAVYKPEKEFETYKNKVTNDEIIKRKLVWDANITMECWITEPVKLVLCGILCIDSVVLRSVAKGVSNKDGNCAKRPIYEFQYHWFVEPEIFREYRSKNVE